MKAQPFVKWAGGKRSLLPTLKKHFPDKFKIYWEPFLGGGAVFFDMAKKNSRISDLNEELIITYLAIKTDVKNVIGLLKKHKKKHCREYFLKIRAQHNLKNPLTIAARMLYLNKTCFNGLYRVNRKGEFNNSFGSYKNPDIVQESNLKACNKLLQGIDMKYQGYEKIKPKKGDFVYLDPPYHDTFIGYNPDVFDEQCQLELKDFCDGLTKKGVKFMLSNSDTDFIKEQYKDYRIRIVTTTRNINPNAKNRKNTKEVLITNY